MPLSVAQLVEQITAAPTRVVLAISGGGSRAIADLLETPGASRTLLEAIVPYGEAAAIDWLGGRPDHFCAPPTARAMALVAFRRARKLDRAAAPSLAGIACTAGLVTDRPKLGPHHAHVAVQTASATATWSLNLQKERRTRAEEEQLVARMILNALAAACGLQARLDLPLLEGEQVLRTQTVAPQSWQDLLLGAAEAVCRGPGDRPAAVLSGSFHPLHAAHRRMAELGEAILGVPVAMELSIVNVDKPPLDYTEIDERLRQFPAEQAVWLTRAATFEEKSQLFPGAMFLVGIDTLRRIVAPDYYPGDPGRRQRVLEQLAERRCGFLVFGRAIGNVFVRLADLDLPDVLREICREVAPEQFREDVSSTAIRKAEAW